MTHAVLSHLRLTFKWALRDRILHAVLGVGGLLFILIPVLSSFSMRQVQETALTLTLSTSSFVQVVLAVQLGAGAVYRDVDRRYTSSVLTLPTSRGAFIVGRFGGIALFLMLCTAIFALLTVIVVPIASSISPSERPVDWSTVALAFSLDACMAVLLSACALIFSVVSTSFTLPFFASLGIYFAGSASQQVYEYLDGPMGEQQTAMVRWTADFLYYLLPNFSAFDFHLQAIYALPVLLHNVLTTFAYFLVYTALLVAASVMIFNRRELP
jgi:ABC-type transport system involved in multi-copper enzyme maturation permease subunit